MTEYRRIYIPGSTWFFTANLANRKNNYLLVEKIDLLRKSFRYVMDRKPFHMDVAVILPDHIHCIWTLPEEDADYSVRWNLIKGYFSRNMEKSESEKYGTSSLLKNMGHPLYK